MPPANQSFRYVWLSAAAQRSCGRRMEFPFIVVVCDAHLPSHVLLSRADTDKLPAQVLRQRHHRSPAQHHAPERIRLSGIDCPEKAIQKEKIREEYDMRRKPLLYGFWAYFISLGISVARASDLPDHTPDARRDDPADVTQASIRQTHLRVGSDEDRSPSDKLRQETERTTDCGIWLVPISDPTHYEGGPPH